ncbi:ABC transporter permease [Clostridium oryzae]|uniref:Putative multiple-sugar transport system permease YteP n=1 Tax=Clostridium oryzae TaxID=1450648 RepID=A0A1V4IM88_9CLOT|nr:ABC transporter permease subunit [Clostridium oryzae]OPJ60954.1 putative multiple-sugar transport system permease YteP [Clostridium oryzae]
MENTVVTQQVKKKKTRHFEDFRKHKTYYFMLIPMVVYFILFCYLPMPGLYFAFVDFDYIKLLRSPFVGFRNFHFLFQGGMDSVIWKLTKNTILYNLAFIGLGNLCQISVAVILKEIKRKYFVKVTQTMMLMPFFVSMVIVGVIVYNVFNYKYGIVNNLLTTVGLPKYDFYQNPGAWPIIIVLINIWKGLGYGTIIYMAAILGIDESIYEAAYIDGASNWKRIWHITLPLLKPTAIMLVLLALGGILKGQFDLFYQIIGNNGMLLNATDIIDTYVYRSLAVDFNMGRGSAAGLYQSLFGFILILSVNKIVNKSFKNVRL